MNIRRVFLSVSMMLGIAMSIIVAAGASAETVGTSITLLDGEGCSASIAGASIDFGSFRWDAAAGTYTFISGSSGGELTIDAVSGSYASSGGCSVTLSASGLENNDTSVTMDGAVILTADGISSNPLTVNVQSGISKTVSASLAPELDLASYVPGSYTGQIVVTSASASN